MRSTAEKKRWGYRQVERGLGAKDGEGREAWCGVPDSVTPRGGTTPGYTRFCDGVRWGRQEGKGTHTGEMNRHDICSVWDGLKRVFGFLSVEALHGFFCSFL